MVIGYILSSRNQDLDIQWLIHFFVNQESRSALLLTEIGWVRVHQVSAFRAAGCRPRRSGFGFYFGVSYDNANAPFGQVWAAKFGSPATEETPRWDSEFYSTGGFQQGDCVYF